MFPVLAQRSGGGFSEWSIERMAIAAVAIAAIVALVFIGFRYFGVAPPQWLFHVIGIVVVACVLIFAIHLIASMW